MNVDIYIDCAIVEDNSYGDIVDCPFDVLKGEKGDTGPDGHTPTVEELTALITPIIQQQLGVIENGSY